MKKRVFLVIALSVFLSPLFLSYLFLCGAGDGSGTTDGGAVTFTGGSISLKSWREKGKKFLR